MGYLFIFGLLKWRLKLSQLHRVCVVDHLFVLFTFPVKILVRFLERFASSIGTRAARPPYLLQIYYGIAP